MTLTVCPFRIGIYKYDRMKLKIKEDHIEKVSVIDLY